MTKLARHLLPMNLWSVLPASCRQGGRTVLPTRCRQHVGSWPVSWFERNKGLPMSLPDLASPDEGTGPTPV